MVDKRAPMLLQLWSGAPHPPAASAARPDEAQIGFSSGGRPRLLLDGDDEAQPAVGGGEVALLAERQNHRPRLGQCPGAVEFPPELRGARDVGVGRGAAGEKIGVALVHGGENRGALADAHDEGWCKNLKTGATWSSNSRRPAPHGCRDG